ncbi:MAG: YHS domain-containing protein [Pyrinomonadaceae bacterium]
MNEKQTTTTETFVDPICGMQVKPATAAGSLNQDGETYYFCSTGCLQKFINPTDNKQSSCCNGG